jgi:hypothetical protein
MARQVRSRLHLGAADPGLEVLPEAVRPADRNPAAHGTFLENCTGCQKPVTRTVLGRTVARPRRSSKRISVETACELCTKTLSLLMRDWRVRAERAGLC